jgi:hypothetical protein
MKLMTKELEKKFTKVGEQIGNKNPTVICKYFTPRTSRTWYVTEYYPDSKVCYWFVEWLESEWWYFALPELESLQWPYGLKIERDIHFGECLFANIKLRWWR